jgi:hypothetical protein
LRTAPVKAPRSWPNSSDSISSSGMAAQLTRMNGRVAARGDRWWMRRATSRRFRLADDQHGDARRGGLGDPLAQLGHRRRVAEQRRRLLDVGTQPAVFLGEAAPLGGVLHHEQQRGALGRLVEEVVGAGFEAPRRRELVAVPGQHDHRHVEAALPQVGQQREAVHARHLDVEEDDVRRLPVDTVERRERVARLGDLEPLSAQGRAHRDPDGRVIVDDQHAPGAVHGG